MTALTQRAALGLVVGVIAAAAVAMYVARKSERNRLADKRPPAVALEQRQPPPRTHEWRLWPRPAELPPHWVVANLTPDVSLERRLAEIGPNARLRLAERFAASGVAPSPAEVALVAVKDEGKLELFARVAKGAPWRLVHAYPVLAQSGVLGPKLRQGDHQVPEGSYRISFLNANSLYHVSMRLDYPNRFDREMAARDRRTNLGGDIMIHGKALSVGCLAVGDLAAEELFVLAADVGIRNVEVLVVPTDFSRGRLVPESLPESQRASLPAAPPWLPVLYRDLSRRLAEYRPG